MKQVFLRDAKAVVEDVPAPVAGEGEVLVRVVRSCISTGTELSGILPAKPIDKASEQSVSGIPLWKQLLTDPGIWWRAIKDPRKILWFLWRLPGFVFKTPPSDAPLWRRVLTDPGLWKRAIQDPKKVVRLFTMLRERGLKYTTGVIEQQLSLASPLGYSAAGVVLETSSSIRDIAPGDRVACAGAQCAHHAEIISVPRNLLVPVPDGVSFDEAAPVALGSIAMQGVRRACPTLGERFVVIGLGLLGQMVVQLLKASGCRVIGTDLDPRRIEKALELGLDHGLNPGETDLPGSVRCITGGDGADGVIITASGPEKILSDAFQMCRRKGRVVLVGDVAIRINRGDIYQKELDFLISTSYGPGRYDNRYEHRGVDYPVTHVRWTENRNMGEYLRLVANGKLRIQPIIGEVCPIEKAEDAYFRLKNHPDKPLMVLLSYPDYPAGELPARKAINHDHKQPEGKRLRVAVIGAGGFSKAIHLPNMKHSEMFALQAIVERKGNDAIAAAKQFNARYAATDYRPILDDPEIDAVFITTRHNLHAPLAIDALKAGKHVFVEKPLAMNREELDAIRNLVQPSNKESDRINGINEIKKLYTSCKSCKKKEGDGTPFIMTGFNRRFSPHVREIRELTRDRKNPMILNYRMNAGYIPLDHWVHGDEGGGRNIGEACHIYDLFTFLTDSPARTVDAKSIQPQISRISQIKPTPGLYRRTAVHLYSSRDNFIATVTFEDGSVATLTYTALGSADYPKEHLDVFCDGRVFVLDNYTTLTSYGIEDVDTKRTPRRREGAKKNENVHIQNVSDKGHLPEITEFARAVLDSQPCPIPFWQQYQAMEIAFEVDRLI